MFCSTELISQQTHCLLTWQHDMNRDKGNMQHCKRNPVASLIFPMQCITELLLVETSARLLTSTVAERKVRACSKQHATGMSIASHDHSSNAAGQAGAFACLVSEAARKLACWCLPLANLFVYAAGSFLSWPQSFAPGEAGPSSFRARFQSPVTPAPAPASASHHIFQYFLS